MEVTSLVNQMKEDPLLVERMKADPVSALQHAAAGSVLASDRFIYRIVVSALSLIALVAMCGALVLTFFGKPTPESAIALGSMALGALAGLLAPSPARTSEDSVTLISLIIALVIVGLILWLIGQLPIDPKIKTIINVIVIVVVILWLLQALGVLGGNELLNQRIGR